MINKRNTRMLIGALLVLLTVVTSYLAQNLRKDTATANQAPAVVKEKSNEDSIRNKVATLLSRDGIRLGQALSAADAQTHRQLRIHWRSFSKTDSSPLIKTEQLVSGANLTRTASSVRDGALPRERSFELAPDRLFVTGVDDTDAVRWWRLIVDPRLVRAEVGSSTEMQSEVYYRGDAELVLECPDDPVLKQLRLYRPVWDGQEFRLELIGAVALD